MIRVTVKQFKRHSDDWNKKNTFMHVELVTKRTYWFLFIPVFSTETISATTI